MSTTSASLKSTEMRASSHEIHQAGRGDGGRPGNVKRRTGLHVFMYTAFAVNPA